MHHWSARTVGWTIAIALMAAMTAVGIAHGEEKAKAPAKTGKPAAKTQTEAQTESQTEVLAEAPITAKDREHWAFRPLKRPPLPTTASLNKRATRRDRVAARNAIDLFVEAKLLEQGLQILPPASPETLARRLAFDLTGLPPTAFPGAFPKSMELAAPRESVATTSDRQWHRTVDALMSSPAYGERWAQHWLDLARFAETDGFEHDKVRANAWRYRDWVVGAWNQGMPYDRFVRDQLAGDRVGSDPVATMFCTSGPDMPDINSQEERKHELLNEMTGVVGAVMLGLQIGCAQCHDHKYDPLSQGDFYRLRAMFEPSVHVVRNTSVGPLDQRDPNEPSRLLIRGDWRRPGPIVQSGVPRIANPSGRRPTSRSELAEWLADPQQPLTARVMVNRLWQHHFGKGLVGTPSDFGAMGDWPSHPELLDYLAVELIEANWSLQRVQRLIVESAAYRQMSYDSSHMARPNAQSGERSAESQSLLAKAFAADPDNQLLSRFPRKRLDGESLRDAMLASSESLNRRMGGPGVRPPLPPELKQTLLRGQWDESPQREHYRRSIYVFARRNLRYPIFEVMDRPDANATCPRRSQSTTAPQALLLFNSPLSLDAAKRLAGYCVERCAAHSRRRHGGDDNDMVRPVIQLIYQRTFFRRPTRTELADATAFITEHAALLANQPQRTPIASPTPPVARTDLDKFQAAALVEFCLAMLNSNEFLYLD